MDEAVPGIEHVDALMGVDVKRLVVEPEGQEIVDRGSRIDHFVKRDGLERLSDG